MTFSASPSRPFSARTSKRFLVISSDFEPMSCSRLATLSLLERVGLEIKVWSLAASLPDVRAAKTVARSFSTTWRVLSDLERAAT